MTLHNPNDQPNSKNTPQISKTSPNPTSSSEERHSPIALELDANNSTSQTETSQGEDKDQEQSQYNDNIGLLDDQMDSQNINNEAQGYSPYKYTMIPCGMNDDDTTSESSEASSGNEDDKDDENDGYYKFGDTMNENENLGQNWQKVSESRGLTRSPPVEAPVAEITSEEQAWNPNPQPINQPYHISTLYSKAFDLPPAPKDSINNEEYKFSDSFEDHRKKNAEPAVNGFDSNFTDFADFSNFEEKTTKTHIKSLPQSTPKITLNKDKLIRRLPKPASTNDQTSKITSVMDDVSNEDFDKIVKNILLMKPK